MAIEPIRKSGVDGDGPERVATLAKRLGVRFKPATQCPVGLVGPTGEFYDWVELVTAFMDWVEKRQK